MNLIVMNRSNGVEKMGIMDRLLRRRQIEEPAKTLEKTSACVQRPMIEAGTGGIRWKNKDSGNDVNHSFMVHVFYGQRNKALS